MARKKGEQDTGTFGHQKEKSGLQQSVIDLVELLSKSTGITDEQRNRIGKAIGLKAEPATKTWTLDSGKVIRLKSVSLTRKEVEENTFVNFEINGRDQDLLTPESLKSLDSMKLQQFYPAIGRRIGQQIDTLDGSRRREKFLQTPEIEFFSMLITDDDITIEDAQQLAKDLQTAISHNTYEIGLRCLKLVDYTQEQIASILGISQTKVSRGIKAANIDRRLIVLFPNSNLIRGKDYDLLNKITDKLNSNEEHFAAYISTVDKLYNKDESSTPGGQHEELVTLIKSEFKNLKSEKDEKPKRIVVDIQNYSESGRFARKVTKDRIFSYEFGRMSKQVQLEIDSAIKLILDNHDHK